MARAVLPSDPVVDDQIVDREPDHKVAARKVVDHAVAQEQLADDPSELADVVHNSVADQTRPRPSPTDWVQMRHNSTPKSQKSPMKIPSESSPYQG
jgi:hypothetical protein